MGFSPSTLSTVVADFTYLAPMAEKPFRLQYEPAPGERITNAVYQSHSMQVFNVRPIASDLDLDREGFALLHRPSLVRDFTDEALIRGAYYEESARIVAEATGASRVEVFDHTVRLNADGALRQPVTRVHNDYTLKSGPQRVRDLMGEEAEDLLKRRFQIVNVWRPINGPAIDMPLAVCDARSVGLEDFVASDLVYRDRKGETYAVRHSPHHQWFYVPEMGEDEVLLLKCYDSAEDGRARFTAHSAFRDPTAPADAKPRESIEIRTLAFFDE